MERLKIQRTGLPENYAIYQNIYSKLDILYHEAEAYRLTQLAPLEAHLGFSSFQVLWRQLAVLYNKVFHPRVARDPRSECTNL